MVNKEAGGLVEEARINRVFHGHAEILFPFHFSMNTFKTLVYMGSMHGFFTFYLPYQLSSMDGPFFSIGVFRYTALLFGVAGTLIMIWCSMDFISRGHGTPAHLDPPKTLVIHGPYQYVRNPIYAGALLVQLGYILWFASGLMILYFCFFLLAFHVLVVFIEEPILKNSFGSAYAEYIKRVPRWIPGM